MPPAPDDRAHGDGARWEGPGPMTDDEHEGIRGDELADEAAGNEDAPTPPAGDGGVRGDVLADDSGATDDAPTAELADDSIRGDGLADDAA
jgi:hypothetical protein